jgi:hypothetical protein
VQAAETLTYMLELTPALSGWLQQLGAAGSGVQSRVEIAVNIMSGGLSSLSLVADSADNSDRLINLDHSAAAQQVTLCLDRVNSAMFTPRCWFVNILADSSGCKLTLAARVATITTTTTADGRKAVQEQHVHLPALMQHGVDSTINAVVDRERERKDRQEGKAEARQSQQQTIAAGSQAADDDAYRKMEESSVQV